MKTLKITTDNKISVVDVNFSDFKAIQQAIGGYFEIVNTQKLRDYFKASVVMIVDEEGVGKFSYSGASSGTGSTEQSIFSPRAERILWPTGLTYRGGSCR